MYYLFALVVPPLVLVLGWRWMGSVKRAATLALVSAMGMYSVTVAMAQAHGGVLERQVARFDLNRDGVFSATEQSPEQQVAFHRLTNDAGRNMTVLLGVPWAFIVSTLVFLVAFAIKRRLTLDASGPPATSAGQ